VRPTEYRTSAISVGLTSFRLDPPDGNRDNQALSAVGKEKASMRKRSQKQPSNPKRDSNPKPARAVPMGEGSEFVMERYGRIREMDRSFDIEYWQRQGDAAIFRAAWELVELYWRIHDRDPNELRLQRSVESFERL
jgi:hypothetical protein